MFTSLLCGLTPSPYPEYAEPVTGLEISYYLRIVLDIADVLRFL